MSLAKKKLYTVSTRLKLFYKRVAATLFVVLSIPPLLFAQITPNGIQTRLDETKERASTLEKEIAAYENELSKTEDERNDLEKALKVLDLTKRQLDKRASYTEIKIGSTTLAIKKLSGNIDTLGQDISLGKNEVSNLVVNIERLSHVTPVEMLLANDSISATINDTENYRKIVTSLLKKVTKLKSDREQSLLNKQILTREMTDLAQLREQLADERVIAQENLKEKNKLIAATKNKEKNYQDVINSKIAEKEAVDKEIYQYETQLKTQINWSEVPSASTGLIAWPLEQVFVTQYFGNTQFAKDHSDIYNGKGHNGIDLRASVGTPVFAAAAGEIMDTGDTDLGCPGGSYGRWVLLKHGNGLTTLYAHLSLIKVSNGQNIARKELIGYSGNSGYSTGPHLHFSLYVSQGVKVAALTKANGSPSHCPPMPVASLESYLNPLLYL